MHIVDSNGKMTKHIIKESLILRNVRLNTVKEFFERNTEGFFNTQRRAIGFHTAGFPAAARQAARFQTHMAELSALRIVSAIGEPLHQNGTAHAVFQREVGEVRTAASDKTFRESACGRIVFNIDRIWDPLCKAVQRNIAEIQRRSDMNPGVVRCDQSRDGDADTQKLSTVDAMVVEKFFQNFRKSILKRNEISRIPGDCIPETEGNRAVKKLPQAQISQNKPQMMFTD